MQSLSLGIPSQSFEKGALTSVLLLPATKRGEFSLPDIDSIVSTQNVTAQAYALWSQTVLGLIPGSTTYFGIGQVP